MKKLLSSLLCVCTISAFADETPAPVICNGDVLNQVKTNHEGIFQAFKKGDGCTAGNLEIKNHQIIQDNLSCFPNYRKGDYNMFHIMDKLDATVYTDTTPTCDKARATVLSNHQKIKAALKKSDGCTAGKLQVQDHKIIIANMACFPSYKNDPYLVQRVAIKYDASAPEEEEESN